jgi:peptidyl-prolyl cis-trans isomerase D
LSAFASKAEVNKLSAPIKGNTAVYVMQVLNKENGTEEFDAKSEESTLSTMSSRFASNFINDLYMKANIKDDRYLYF